MQDSTAVCRVLANQKSEKRYCACAVLERSKEKLERIAFRFFGSCKNSANRRTDMGFFFFLMLQSDFMVNFVMESDHIPSQNLQNLP